MGYGFFLVLIFGGMVVVIGIDSVDVCGMSVGVSWMVLCFFDVLDISLRMSLRVVCLFFLKG